MYGNIPNELLTIPYFKKMNEKKHKFIIIHIKSTLSNKKMKITRCYREPEDNYPLGHYCFYLEWDIDPLIHCGYCQWPAIPNS